MEDRKLDFHIRKYYSSKESKDKSRISVDELTFYLVETFPEYRRRPQTLFKSTVGQAMLKYSNNNNNNSKRQKKNTMMSISDDEEAAFQKHEERMIATAGPKVTNLLNQNLTKNYKQAAAKKQDQPEPEDKPKKSKRKSSSRSAASESNIDDISFLKARPTARYSDIGGIQAILTDVKDLIENPLKHPEVYSYLGVEPPRGILLHGPPGTGKSMLANAIAGEAGASFLKVSAPEMVSGMSGESEQKLRRLFDEAIENAPAIIFIDEIDAITPKRETSQRGMEKRMVAQLLTCTDSLGAASKEGKSVVIIGATNMPDSLDPALRRAGRFDREICIGIPDEDAREGILRVLCKNMKVDDEVFDFKDLARRTPGFVGADLVSLTKEAANIAVKRVFSKLTMREEPFTNEELVSLRITNSDFFTALPKVQPSSKREGFATIPDVTWNDVGALAKVREELSLSILHPILYPERFATLGLTMPAGVLLFGPPGCGKTLLAKAIANESRANFISVKGPELLDKYVGESERAVRQVFQRARASAPCVVFFDELDALCPRRGSGSDGGGGGVSERVVNQLLTEMDGLESRRSIFVIAATNRPDIIDPAMLRPGRLDKLLYVPLPEAEDREAILKSLTGKIALEDDVDLGRIAMDPRCNGFSGADLSSLVREAGFAALREAGGVSSVECNDEKFERLKITHAHFGIALQSVLPSVSKADQRVYNKMRGNLRKARRTLDNAPVIEEKVDTKKDKSTSGAPSDSPMKI